MAHAHVIRLLDVCASKPGREEDPRDLPTLVFPPADVDLATFLNRRPRGVLPTALARRMMGQLASALAQVHSHSIIHRGVKPASCLIFFAAEIHEEFGLRWCWRISVWLGVCLRTRAGVLTPCRGFSP